MICIRYTMSSQGSGITLQNVSFCKTSKHFIALITHHCWAPVQFRKTVGDWERMKEEIILAPDPKMPTLKVLGRVLIPSSEAILFRRIKKHLIRKWSTCSKVQHCLVWERSSARVEGVVARVFKQIFNRRHIEVGKANQSSREIRRVVVSPEDTAKSRVEQRFQLLSEGLTTIIIFLTKGRTI